MENGGIYLDNGSSLGTARLTLLALLDRLARSTLRLALLDTLGSLLDHWSSGYWRSTALGALVLASILTLGDGLLLLADVVALLLALRHALGVLLSYRDFNLITVIRYFEKLTVSWMV